MNKFNKLVSSRVENRRKERSEHELSRVRAEKVRQESQKAFEHFDFLSSSSESETQEPTPKKLCTKRTERIPESVSSDPEYPG